MLQPPQELLDRKSFTVVPHGKQVRRLLQQDTPSLAEMASHHMIQSMLSTAMDRSSGAPSMSRQAKLAPILSGDRIVRCEDAEELRNHHVFSANGSWGSSSQAWYELLQETRLDREDNAAFTGEITTSPLWGDMKALAAEACSVDPAYNLGSDVIEQLWPVVASMKKELMQKEKVVQ
ncbi:hypothetical protein ZWY2020_046838 [Hordeum vulgare]|nr:hypothetical protein ZWY2020_046838 [Hordeum vulgare]